MDSTLQLSENIIRIIKDGANAPQVSKIVEWYLDDVFKLLKNINETSLNETDRHTRIMELKTKYMFPVQHLLNQ